MLAMAAMVVAYVGDGVRMRSLVHAGHMKDNLMCPRTRLASLRLIAAHKWEESIHSQSPVNQFKVHLLAVMICHGPNSSRPSLTGSDPGSFPFLVHFHFQHFHF